MSTIKILFFDMEFSNGKIKGSVYSLGYMITDESFHVLTPPTDLLIAPECEWNEYVTEHILAYPIEEVEAAPAFPARYEEIAALFSSVDVAVGFSVGNDVRALRADCLRYGLPVLSYRWFDVERLCKLMEAHREAHGLDGCFTAWCGGEAENRHRSDGDAYATARVMQEICRAKRVDAEMMIVAYPECTGDAADIEKKKTPSGEGGHRRFRRPRRGTGRASAPNGKSKKTEKENVS